MTKRQELEIREHEIKGRLGELADLQGEQRTEEIEGEQRTLVDELKGLQPRMVAAIAAEEADPRLRGTQTTGDGENRERLELRGRARVGAYLAAALRGRMVNGAEAELQEAANVDGIPLELWEPTPEQRAALEHRVISEAPGTVGINLDPIRPAVFAPSVLPRLGVEMPMVGSGTFATGTVSASTTAGAVAKSAAVPSTAATITVGTTTPHRIGARLELTLEDIAAVGAENFEAILRQNISLALSDEIDNQGLNGAGGGSNLSGLFQRLTDPSAPAAGVATFDSFVAAFAGGIDGLWAVRMGQVAIVAGVETYQLSAKTFRDASGQDLGDMAFADYAMGKFGGWWTNKRMPVKAAHIQQAILYRMGRSLMGGSEMIRTAVCPHWGYVSIDDIYSGSAKGERYFTASVLLGDVLVVQPRCLPAGLVPGFRLKPLGGGGFIAPHSAGRRPSHPLPGYPAR